MKSRNSPDARFSKVSAAAPSVRRWSRPDWLKSDPAQAYIAESTAARRAARRAVALKVNGKSYSVEVEHRNTLAEVLRDQLGLTGTKIGCDRGECGACTVIIDGRNMYSCSQLAVWMEGKEILTIEGLAKGDKLDPVQEAFIEHDGPQCGFCTSGQIMSGKALLMKNPKPNGSPGAPRFVRQSLPLRQLQSRGRGRARRRGEGALREVVMAQAQKEFSVVGKKNSAHRRL